MQSLRRSVSWLAGRLAPSSSSVPKAPPILLVQWRALSTTPALDVRKWGPGIKYRGIEDQLTLFGIPDGKRENMPCALDRFKRLDSGLYIRPRAGRAKKHWMKTAKQLFALEQHVFCVPFHRRRLDRMFEPEAKRPRFQPDDPYEKYNRMRFVPRKYAWLKNRARMERAGVDNPLAFDRYKAHLSHHKTGYNKVRQPSYAPPGFWDGLADNGGVYDPEEFVPMDKPAPHFQRKLLIKKNMVDGSAKRFHRLQDVTFFSDPWSSAMFSRYKKVWSS